MLPLVKYKINIVLIICIFINIIGLFVIKDAWVIDTEEDVSGWQYQVSKALYGLIILIMLPSLIRKNPYFNSFKWLVAGIFVYMAMAYLLQIKFNLGSYFRFVMLCLSFLFFYDQMLKHKVNQKLVSFYIISLVVNVSYLTIVSDQVGKVIETGRAATGQSAALALVFLLPLVFYLYKSKTASYFYIFFLIIGFISLRRTTILALLLCLPFIYKTLKSNISRKQLFVIMILIAFLIYYILVNYWDVIELRFADMFKASDSGNYGSERTGWFALLFENYIESPLNWIFGFGLGSVTMDMERGGYPFEVAHNDFLEILYTFGIWGLCFWLKPFYKIYKFAQNRLSGFKREQFLLYMTICSYLFIASVSGSIFKANSITMSFFICLLITDFKYLKK